MDNETGQTGDAAIPDEACAQESRRPLRIRRRKPRALNLQPNHSPRRRAIFYDEHPMTLYRKAFLVVITVITVPFAFCLLCAGVFEGAEWIDEHIYAVSPALFWFLLTVTICCLIAAFCAGVRIFRRFRQAEIAPYRQPDPNAVQHWD